MATAMTTAEAATGGMSMAYDYIRDPAEIYRRSFAAIDASGALDRLPEDMRPMAARLIHACGQEDLAHHLAHAPAAAAAGRKALEAGAPLLVDAEMVAAGIIAKRLPAANQVICTLNAPGVAEAAEAAGITRSAAALDLWPNHLGGAVVAIGNAPTALFRLLEGLGEGWPRPALILGFPVGFIGASESKDALAEAAPAMDIAFVTLRGRSGGSALAAAAVNALAAEPGT